MSEASIRRPSRLPVFATWGLLLSTLVGGLPAQAQDLKEIAAAGRRAVVVLLVTGGSGREIGQGTGFFVSDGVIVTNYHVVSKAAQMTAVLEDGLEVPVDGVLAWDEDHDLALVSLSLPAVAAGRRNLPLAETPVVPGDDVVVVGNPLGLSHTLSTGIVAAVRESEDMSLFSGEVIQFTAAISPGSSGSPVMNLAGEVVGVVSSTMLIGQNLNFAVPVSHVRRLLRTAADVVQADNETGLQRSFDDGKSFVRFAYARNVVISLLFFGGVYWGFRRLR